MCQHPAPCLQGSVILMYNWVRTDAVPHTWVTALIEDLALPVNFIGLSTQDRRFLSPIKEVLHALTSALSCQLTHEILVACERCAKCLLAVVRLSCSQLPGRVRLGGSVPQSPQNSSKFK